jgi:hypothetical protein
MQVARRRWSAVLIAGSALAPKGVCMRLWLFQSAPHALSQRDLGQTTTRVRAGTAANAYRH